MEMELVVAHFREDLRWLNRIVPTIPIRIYHKGEAASPPPYLRRPVLWHTLPNVGREAHTYLHHICLNLPTLSGLIVFCQGFPFPHCWNFHRELQSLASTSAPPTFVWLGHSIDTDDSRGRRLFVPWSKNPERRELAMGSFWHALFNQNCPETIPFVLGAQFAVPAGIIQRQALDFYRRALTLAESFPDAAHCFERCWDRVFGIAGIDRAWLAGRLTVHLKPIRRLQPAGLVPSPPPPRH